MFRKPENGHYFLQFHLVHLVVQTLHTPPFWLCLFFNCERRVLFFPKNISLCEKVKHIIDSIILISYRNWSQYILTHAVLIHVSWEVTDGLSNQTLTHRFGPGGVSGSQAQCGHSEVEEVTSWHPCSLPQAWRQSLGNAPSPHTR